MKGKCNSTLVLYLLNISVLSVRENSAASVGLAGPARKFLSIFYAVLLSLQDLECSTILLFMLLLHFPDSAVASH